MDNPFSLKVGQVFTGFGVGCGVGIGIGRPIYFGAIPALQPVLSATRGATDILSGVGRHFNSSLRKLGMKGIEAGIGCGVGIGHGFGVGIAVKPWVLPAIHNFLTESVIKVMASMGIATSLTSVKNLIPAPPQTGTLTSNIKAYVSGPLDVSKTSQSTFQHLRTDGTDLGEITSNTFERKDTFSSSPLKSQTEKVLNNFVQSSTLKNESEVELEETAQHLRAENAVLHLLLRHQEIIQKLTEENEKLQRILIEDLRVPPEKLQASTNTSFTHLSANCFECRRRRRKSKP